MKKAKKEKKQKLEKEEKDKKIVITEFIGDNILSENSDESRELYNQGRYGTLLDNGRVQLSLIESLYLLEKKRIEILK